MRLSFQIGLRVGNLKVKEDLKFKKIVFLVLIFIIFCFLFIESFSKESVTIATTNSVVDSKILQKPLKEFKKIKNIEIKLLGVGSGEAMELAKLKAVDFIITHAPKQEKEFIKKGFGKKRHFLFKNYFLLIGPKEDPADVKGKSILSAFKRIYQKKLLFISRADKSGTHLKEKEIWEILKLNPQKEPWYIKTGSGMANTLIVANNKSAYTLTDEFTYNFFKDKLKLCILSIKEELLQNPYSLIELKNTKPIAKELINFLIDYFRKGCN